MNIYKAHIGYMAIFYILYCFMTFECTHDISVDFLRVFNVISF